jgi:hypothetical protein
MMHDRARNIHEATGKLANRDGSMPTTTPQSTSLAEKQTESMLGGSIVQTTHKELAPFSRRGADTARKRRLEGVSSSHIFLIVLLGIGLPVAVAASLWSWSVRAPDVAGPPHEGSTDTGVAPAKESEADTIKNAIASKPAELRQTLSEYAKTSEDIKRILSQGLEAKNIGGAIAVAIANLQKNIGGGIDSPEQLGFRRIDNDKALVNHVLKGDADIKTVTVSREGNHLFKVTIEMKNNTGFPLTCIIPKGQLVEMKDAKNTSEGQIVNAMYNAAGLPQVPAKASDEKDKGGMTVVPPWEPAKIEFIAYCANPDLPEPQGRANLAIYALEDTSYKTWKDLRDIRIKKLNLRQRTNTVAHA